MAYHLTKRGESFVSLIESIVDLGTEVQLRHLHDWLLKAQHEVRTDSVREDLAQITAELSAQLALMKALYSLVPKNIFGKGTDYKLKESD